MSPKTIAYLGILFVAIVVLALGGWVVNGAKALMGQKRRSSLRTSFA